MKTFSSVATAIALLLATFVYITMNKGFLRQGRDGGLAASLKSNAAVLAQQPEQVFGSVPCKVNAQNIVSLPPLLSDSADFTNQSNIIESRNTISEYPGSVVCGSCSYLMDILRRTYGATNSIVLSVHDVLQAFSGGNDMVFVEPPIFTLICYRKNNDKIYNNFVEVVYDLNNQYSDQVMLTKTNEFAERQNMFWLLGSLSSCHNVFQINSYGNKLAENRFQHQVQQATQGDLTFIQTETIIPIHFLCILTRPGMFLPACLQRRVTGVIVEAEMGPTEWQCRVQLKTESPQAANATLHTLEAWRVVLGQISTNTERKNKAIESSPEIISRILIKIIGNNVLMTINIPSITGVCGVNRSLQLLASNHSL